MIPEPLPWMADALCSQTAPDVFFPESGESSTPAKQVCRQCPVADLCLVYAQEIKPQWGIWAGYSVGQLARMRQKANAA